MDADRDGTVDEWTMDLVDKVDQVDMDGERRSVRVHEVH